MPIRHNQTARYRLSILLKGTIDASSAANLPSSPTGGDTYQVTTPGDFGGSALINPAGAYFDNTNYVAYNAETIKWDKIDTTENISDAAYDATGWLGVTRDAPSKNAVRNKIFAMDASIAVVSGEADNIETAVGLNTDGTFIAHTTSNYMNAATTTKQARELLDTALNGHVTSTGTAVHGLGTMSTQNANNVAIMGGAIDGTTIGGTTPAAVTATSVTTPDVASADNAAALTINLPVSGADAGAHTVAVNLDSTTVISATGTATAGVIGAKTVTVGASGDTVALAGTPTAATAASGTNTTQVATTAFTNSAAIKYAIVFG